MKIELLLQSAEDGVVYDISELAEPIQVTKSINGTAGKLTCVLQKDPYNKLKITNGDIIRFKVDDVGIFFGYVFMIGTDADENYKLTCYDQTRYLKNSDIYTFKGITASNIFAKICKDFGLKYKIKVPTTYVPSPYQFTNKSLYSIVERGMNLASINEKKRYFIKDEFGTLVWSEISYEGERLGVVLGNASGITSYTFEKSIDNDTYNQVKLYKENTNTHKIDTWIVKDSDNIKRWGILQLLKQANDSFNSAQVTEQAKNYLSVKNRETQKLKIQADGIPECEAGKTIRVALDRQYLKDNKIDQWMWITASTHTYSKYEHTMDLELEVGL